MNFAALANPPSLAPHEIGAFHLKQATIINFCKGATPVVILALIWRFSHAPFYASENPIAWAYFGVHGCYGLLWVGKSWAGFGDSRFMVYKHFSHNALTFCGLVLYWLPIWIVVQQKPAERAHVSIIGLSVLLFGLGVFWHFAADVHKAIFLEYRAVIKESVGANHELFQPILKTKLWAVSRNPNYFGELLIYASFCILPCHWAPFVWLAVMVSGYWYASMLLKEKSLSRFGHEWQQYKESSSFFIPYIW